MTDLKLFCIENGKRLSNPFSVKITVTDTTIVDDLREVIKAKKANVFQDIDADELTLWSVSIRNTNVAEDVPIFIDNFTDANKLLPRTQLSTMITDVWPDDKTYIIVQRPPPAQLPTVNDYISLKRPTAEELYLPSNKKIRIIEGWKQYAASDGKVVNLPPPWIDLLASPKFVPEPRTAFDHIKNELRAGDAIIIPSMGQNPKHSSLHSQSRKIFVTEQMLELWEDMRGDKEHTYTRLLSGPMGVGKSYLSYFLTAKAYAERWPVLYISDAKLLDRDDENKSAWEVLKRFLAFNKDILTGDELELLVNDYDGTRNISRDALSVIFGTLLMMWERKTLLLVDEHGKLFEQEPYLPNKFKSLVPLSSYQWWGEDAKGSRVIFTGISHAKYEMTILDESYWLRSVVFVGPLSRDVFSNMLDTYPRLRAPVIRREVIEITNCVPRELVYLSANVAQFPDPISLDDLQKWTESRTKHFLSIAQTYYESRSMLRKEQFYKALLQTFLGTTSTVDFDWDFLDLGLIYRAKDITQIGPQHHILCRPAQKALLELFKLFPLPEDTKKRICDGSLNGVDFETALCHQLICATKPIVFNATDLNGRNPTTISLDFSHCDTLQIGKISLGSGYENVLTRGYERYPRFDFMLGPLFIQASISDFGQHNKGSADIRKAFNDGDVGPNQIERYLNDMFGPGHSAKIENNRFVVTKGGVPVSGFRIVYIRGSPGKPTHREWVNKLPDLLHISFEELTEKLSKNIVSRSSRE